MVTPAANASGPHRLRCGPDRDQRETAGQQRQQRGADADDQAFADGARLDRRGQQQEQRQVDDAEGEQRQRRAESRAARAEQAGEQGRARARSRYWRRRPGPGERRSPRGGCRAPAGMPGRWRPRPRSPDRCIWLGGSISKAIQDRRRQVGGEHEAVEPGRVRNQLPLPQPGDRDRERAVIRRRRRGEGDQEVACVEPLGEGGEAGLRARLHGQPGTVRHGASRDPSPLLVDGDRAGIPGQAERRAQATPASLERASRAGPGTSSAGASLARLTASSHCGCGTSPPGPKLRSGRSPS